MIEYKILSPNEGGRSQDQNINDYKKRIWRVYFYDSKNYSESKEAYIDSMGLKFKAKIDCKDIEAIRNYLKEWIIKYLQDKKFEDIKNGFKIKL